MNRIATVSGFLPPEAFLLLLVAAGIALVLGARRLAAVLVATIAAGIFLPPIVDPILDSLPLWLLVVVGLVGGLLMLRAISEFVIGKESTDNAVGTLAADAFKGLIALPFRLLRWIVGLFLPRR